MSVAVAIRPVRAVEPFRGVCPSCGVVVLEVLVRGRPVVVEVAEVLEAFACPDCLDVAGRGHVRSGCDRCHLTGWIGEVLPLRGVAVDSFGRARIFTARGRYRGRSEHEAVHRLHFCPV